MPFPFYSFIALGMGILAAAIFTYQQRALTYEARSPRDREYTPSNSWSKPSTSHATTRPRYDRKSKCVICVMDLEEPVHTFNCTQRHTVHMMCKEQIDQNNIQGCPICG